MRTIYKYPLKITDVQEIEMFEDPVVRFVAVQGGQLCIWVEVDTKAPKMLSRFVIVGTGNPMPDDDDDACLLHCGSVQMGPFVWHVYHDAAYGYEDEDDF